MFRLIRPFTVVISVFVLLLWVLTACNANRAAQLVSTPAKVAANPTAAPRESTPTKAAAEAMSTPTKAAVTPAASKVMTSTTETNATPLAAKSTATPTSSEAITSTTGTNTTPTAPKATPASLKANPSTGMEEFMAQTTTDKTLGEILTDNKGMTLYTFKKDKPDESTCADACAVNWPPVIVKDEQAKLSSGTAISGKFGVIERKDGSYQVTYNKMPLYRYIKDTKPGDVTGENVGELWHVVTVSTP